mgnify:CR=1 FL=1
MEEYDKSVFKQRKNENQQYYIKGYNKGYNDGWWAGMGGFFIALCIIKFIMML